MNNFPKMVLSLYSLNKPKMKKNIEIKEASKDEVLKISKEVYELTEEKKTCINERVSLNSELERITGAAMMEPDIRIMTNELGFCQKHFPMIYKTKNKLSVGLILESHLHEIQKEIFDKNFLFDKKGKLSRVEKLQESCFVCDKINHALSRQLETVVLMFERDRDFRDLYKEQPVICLEHYKDLVKVAHKKLKGKLLSDFLEITDEITKKYLDTLQSDVSHFTKMFDYRNSGEDADWGNSKDSLQRALWFLTSREV